MVTAQDVHWTHAGDTLRGYAARPADGGPAPGLVLIPDVRGLSDHYRDVARRFAAEGFVGAGGRPLQPRGGARPAGHGGGLRAASPHCPTRACWATSRPRSHISAAARKSRRGASASPASASAASTR